MGREALIARYLPLGCVLASSRLLRMAGLAQRLEHVLTGEEVTTVMPVYQVVYLCCPLCDALC